MDTGREPHTAVRILAVLMDLSGNSAGSISAQHQYSMSNALLFSFIFHMGSSSSFVKVSQSKSPDPVMIFRGI